MKYIAKKNILLSRVQSKFRDSVFLFAIRIFDSGARVKFVVVQILQTILGLLDLVGVAIIGVIGSLEIGRAHV